MNKKKFTDKGLDLKNLLFILTIAVIIFVIVNILVTVIKISYIKKEFTGYTSSYVNITVNSVVTLDLMNSTINWGSGVVNSTSNSTLYTQGFGKAVVLRGNWSTQNVSGIVIRNTGNINCSLFIRSGKNAHEFFNSLSYSNEEYKFNVSNKKVNSCSGGALLDVWLDVNKTDDGTKYCSQFDFHSSNNEIFLDVLLSVPYDASNLGPQSDVIVVTAYSA
jgi:hypothetical protein